MVVDSEGWQDSGDQYEKKFYYEDEENPKNDSKIATYIVIFKPNSTKVLDTHVNVW